MEKDGERAFWLAWAQINGIGPVLLQRLQQHFGSLESAWLAQPSALAKVEGFGEKMIEGVITERSRLNPAQILLACQQKNPNFWTPVDADYPRLLLEIPSPPPVLFYKGTVESSENLGVRSLVGIVGTRHPSEYGKRWTRKISAALAQNGFTVVSGMADGIDTEAHRSCLEAGGRTIAVLGTGVDVIYPPANRELYQQIINQGLVLSEFSAGTPPDRAHFPRRNRIIAGLSRAVLVMEAPTKSGALITARYANDFCRDVYAMPARLDDEKSQGCLRLLNQGAQPIVREIDELLKMLGAIPQLDPVETSSAVEQLTLPNLSPELAQVLNAIALESVSFDLIVQQTSLPPGGVASALLQLELMGLVSQLPGMRYQRC